MHAISLYKIENDIMFCNGDSYVSGRYVHTHLVSVDVFGKKSLHILYGQSRTIIFVVWSSVRESNTFAFTYFQA